MTLNPLPPLTYRHTNLNAHSPLQVWHHLWTTPLYYHSLRSWKYQDFFFKTMIKTKTFILRWRPRPFFMSLRSLEAKTKVSRLHPYIIVKVYRHENAYLHVGGFGFKHQCLCWYSKNNFVPWYAKYILVWPQNCNNNFTWHNFFPDSSLTFPMFDDFSLASLKFPDISRFSRQVVTLVAVWLIRDGAHTVGI